MSAMLVWLISHGTERSRLTSPQWYDANMCVYARKCATALGLSSSRCRPLVLSRVTSWKSCRVRFLWPRPDPGTSVGLTTRADLVISAAVPSGSLVFVQMSATLGWSTFILVASFRTPVLSGSQLFRAIESAAFCPRGSTAWISASVLSPRISVIVIARSVRSVGGWVNSSDPAAVAKLICSHAVLVKRVQSSGR